MLIEPVAGGQRDQGLAQYVLWPPYTVFALRPVEACRAIVSC
jgi:hypothetical protein